MPSKEQKRDYHAARARAELESAYRASRPETTALHLELSSMHLREALSLGAPFGQRLAGDLGWLQDFAPAHRQWLRRDEDRAIPDPRHDWPLQSDLTAPPANAQDEGGDCRLAKPPRNLSLRWPGTIEAVI